MILVCYGTRPEWIKVKPIIDAIDCRVLFTGQHSELANNKFDKRLKIHNYQNRLDSIFASVMQAEDIFEGIDSVMVQGDTASAAAIALSAYNRKIKVIHLEAGLRTYDLDNPYPEEAYRQIISRISDINLCPTELNKANLLQEKTNGKIYVVGNTVLDNLKDIDITYGNEILVTMHRRENHDILPLWFNEISKLALKNKDLKFTIPLHPNPNVQKCVKYLNGVHVIPPLTYEKMKSKIASCRFIISDSGGLQEEAIFLNKKIIVCRKETERTETIGQTSFLCESPDLLNNIFNDINNDYLVPESNICPYGDGFAAKKIKQILENKSEL